MNFRAYIDRQKNIIRGRRAGNCVYFEKGYEYYVAECDRLYCELNGLKGLNTFERLSCADVRSGETV